VCDQLRRSRVHPLRGGPATRVRRAPDGGFETAVATAADRGDDGPGS
jgi:hypothetical protein